MATVWLATGAAALGLAILTIMITLRMNPVSAIARILLKLGIGGALLLAVNWMGGTWFSLPINPVTALLTGYLGIPGLILVGLIAYRM
ncbi:MAG: pro-sigmaK processing inhibitor BofA family protein [Solirubrobacterales bacterium]